MYPQTDSDARQSGDYLPHNPTPSTASAAASTSSAHQPERESTRTMEPYIRGTTSTTSTTNTEQTEEEIAQLLKRRATRHIDLVRNNDWMHPDWAVVVAEDFHTFVPSAWAHPAADGRAAYIEGSRVFKAANPAYDLVPTRMDAEVDASRTTGRVWVTLEVHGHPPPLVRESVCVMHFQLTARGWRLVMQEALRGPQEL